MGTNGHGKIPQESDIKKRIAEKFWRIVGMLVGTYDRPGREKKIKLVGGKDLNVRLTFLVSRITDIERKIIHISELRQRNLNCSLLIFAGLSTATVTLAPAKYSILVPIGLLAVMCIFCRLDRRLHVLTHSWNGTKNELISAAESVINDPSKEVKFTRYAKSKEPEAELNSLMPVVFYCLVAGSVVLLAFSAYIVCKGVSVIRSG